MKRAFLLVGVSFALNLSGAIHVGDTVPNLCWKDVEAKTICLDDFKDTVRVLLFNAGWCHPCNMEMDAIVPRVKEFEGKPVTFISLSVDGWQSGDGPGTQFLKEWKAQHKIPFSVAASIWSEISYFGGGRPAVPDQILIDKQGKFNFKGVGSGAEAALIQRVRQLLQRP